MNWKDWLTFGLWQMPLVIAKVHGEPFNAGISLLLAIIAAMYVIVRAVRETRDA